MRPIYQPCRHSLTSIGALEEQSAVNPTISLKNIVTLSNVSGTTCFPCFNSLAIDLKMNYTNDYLELRMHALFQMRF